MRKVYRLEKEVEKDSCALMKERGILTPKWMNPFESGWPDRIIIPRDPHPVFFIEMKRPGEKATRLQKIRHEAIRRNGKDIYIVDHPDQIQTILETRGIK